MNLFIHMIGDLDVREIGTEHLIAFRRGLLTFPRIVPTNMRDATFKKLIAYGETLAQSERLDRRTDNKGINAIGTLLKMAISEGLIDRNVAAGCRLKITDKKERQKLPFTIPELNKLVVSPIFADPMFRPKAGGEDAAFWLPILAMFTACRMEELGQLLVSDVKIIEGIACLVITDIPEESERTKKKDANKISTRAKHVKSEAANRTVLLHPEILKLGFMAYVERVRKISKDRLFPGLRAYGDKVTKNFSRFINRYIDEHVTDDPRKNFHSFRHGAIDALRDNAFENTRVLEKSGVPQTLSETVGHADTATTEHYGLGSSIQKLYREICKLEYRGLDLSKVRSTF